MNVIFDLDDTLADSSRRVAKYLYEPGGYAVPERRILKPDWDAFFAECLLDTPILPTCAIYKALRADSASISIRTGRCESVRAKTEQWLKKEDLLWATHPHDELAKFGLVSSEPVELIMRPEGDRTDDHLLKEKWLLESIDKGWIPDLVFEDRTRLVNMYRSYGIRTLQVGPGDF